MVQPMPMRTAIRPVLFRFFFILFLLYSLFNPYVIFPFADPLYDWYMPFLHRLVSWIGDHILHLRYAITIFTNRSGDTTYDYIAMLVVITLSILGCLIWTIIAGRHKNYDAWYYWLTVMVRYYLGITMLTYGFFKVFKLQFPYPNAFRLSESMGDASPMGLLWACIGYSKGYNIFIGLAEVAGGLLLLFRRTATAGAMLTLVVAGHIMALNYFYDIPVKILSTTLVGMALFLLAENMKRLWQFFFTREAVALYRIVPPVISKVWLRRTLPAAKYLLIAYALFTDISTNYTALRNSAKSPLAGIYNVVSVVKNRDTLPPLQTDTSRWKQLLIDGYKTGYYAGIRTMNDTLRQYRFLTDTVHRKITLTNAVDTTDRFVFRYDYPAPGEWVLNGCWRRDSLQIRMRKYPQDRFLLKNRGFHWINEYPLDQ